MNVTDLGDSIFRNDLNMNPEISTSSIVYWISSAGIDRLNVLLNRNFFVNDTFQIINNDDGSPISGDESTILSRLYVLNFIDRQIQKYLGAAAYDVLQVESDGGVVRLVDKNIISRTFLQLRNEIRQELKELVNLWRIKKYSPCGIFGDDTLTSRIPYPGVRIPYLRAYGTNVISEISNL